LNVQITTEILGSTFGSSGSRGIAKSRFYRVNRNLLISDNESGSLAAISRNPPSSIPSNKYR
jgi:hypothetical protein